MATRRIILEKSRLLVIGLLIGLLLAACQATSGVPAESALETQLDWAGSQRPTPVPVPDFTLTDQRGQAFRLSDQRGRVVVLFFGYTHCPDICPTNLAVWSRVEADLGADAKRVRFVYVTADPDRDTPQILGQYLKNFSPNFIGLTGAPDALEKVYETYRVIHQKQEVPGSAIGYAMAHSTDTDLIDPSGGWNSVLTFGVSEKDTVQAIRDLLP